MHTIRTALVACVAALALPATAPAQQVYNQISPQRLEGILSSMGYEYKKIDEGKGKHYYDLKVKGLTLRLTSFKGQDLMLDVLLPAIEWKEINRWNGKAKFSRARLTQDSGGKDSVALEYNLDLLGGVTDDTIKQYLRTFENEIVNFDKFAKANPVAVGPEDVYRGIPADRLEKILGELNIKYNKKPIGKDMVYTFVRNKYEIRLTNFNGEDLMIDAHFPATELTKLNAWNLKRSYIRAVLYTEGTPQTALEANLDCAAGISDSIVRYFITTFDSEVRDFDSFLKK